MEKILVIGPFNENRKAALSAASDERFELEYITSEEEYGALKDADYVILRTLKLTADDIATMDHVKLIQRWGVGYDTVDIGAAAARGIPVAITYGMNSQPVAEMAMALMLAVYRNLVAMTNTIQNGGWDRDEFSKKSLTINGKTVGIIGIGNIGRKVAAMCQAFGAKVIYYDLFRLPEGKEQEMGITYYDLDDIWDKCDIISLHAPATEETRHMVNAGTLAKMKDSAVLINTAREELVDMPALASALKNGKLRGAGLDAVEPETMAAKPFEGMDNVVLTAHLGGDTGDNAVHMADCCLAHIKAISEGQTLHAPTIVNEKLM